MAWQPLPDSVTVTFDIPKPQKFTLDPAKTAIVVVDMENAFCTPSFPMYGTRSEDAIAGNVALLEKARAAGAKVIYIQSVRKPDMAEVTRFGREPHLIEGSADTEIVSEISPMPGEPIVKKYSHDPFARTELEAVLEREGIVQGEWSVIVSGVSAAVCAHACALGFANRHYYTIIPMDATAAASVEEEARIYAQYSGGAYNYCMGFTTSDLVEFVAGVGELKPAKELVAVG